MESLLGKGRTMQSVTIDVTWSFPRQSDWRLTGMFDGRASDTIDDYRVGAVGLLDLSTADQPV